MKVPARLAHTRPPTALFLLPLPSSPSALQPQPPDPTPHIPITPIILAITNPSRPSSLISLGSSSCGARSGDLTAGAAHKAAHAAPDFGQHQASLDVGGAQHVRVLLRPADQVGEHLVERAIRKVLVGAVAVSGERVGEKVAHALQLAKLDAHVAGVDAEGGHGAHRPLAALLVVGRDHQVPSLGRHAVKHHLHAPVEIVVCVLDGVVDGGRVAQLLCALALEIHVRAAH
mmetsp:Transcript_32752/g.58681  ORF Transcript_32752/g.58681 Transcript_32752/m.58681 type:complete len:230 (-) Transcript_32752:1344-2033(-)